MWLLGHCTNGLNSHRGTVKVTLLWVADHRNIESSERANGLVRRNSALGNLSEGAARVPLTTVMGGIYSHYSEVADLRWRRLTTCNKARRTT